LMEFLAEIAIGVRVVCQLTSSVYVHLKYHIVVTRWFTWISTDKN
jgi:hypothetical protein